MATKHEHTAGLNRNHNNAIISLFFEFAQLKNLLREGWVRRGVPNPESDADHCLSLGILAYVIATEYRPDLDPRRVLETAVFHEVGEIYALDIIPDDGITPEAKFRLEHESVKKVFRHLPNPQRYVDIWLEYSRQESPEARFVKKVDKLEFALQGAVYERLGHGPWNEVFDNVRARLDEPNLVSILEDIVSQR